MKKLIFRILGALASALIVVSVFVPFVSVTGFSQSLWQAHEATGTLYLPIMIIVFGAIGVIFFSINIKTELAYTSSGALSFFLIMQTIPIIDQGTFKSLSVGYYSLVIGALLTGIMCFLCNLKTKTKALETPVVESKEVSMINQIDKLYDNNDTIAGDNQNAIDNIIQPLQIEPLIQEENNVTDSIAPQNNLVTYNSPAMDLASVQGIETNHPIVEQVSSPQTLSERPIEPTVVEVEPQIETVSNINPTVSEFSVPAKNITEEPNFVAPQSNVQDSNQLHQQEIQLQSNPVLAEFQTQTNFTDSNQLEEQNIQLQQTPVVSEYNNYTNEQTFVSGPVQSNEPLSSGEPIIDPIAPLNNNGSKVDIMADPTNNTGNNLDIFR